MALVNLQTDLKSLKFGKDRPGGGSSNQPYIEKPLNLNLPPALDFLGNDFILRGGPVGAPLATANDVARLTKYFTDFKTPSGLLFVAKQNLLSRTAVKTQTSGLVNEGIYTPLSTLAQAGVSAFGLHLNKQGLNPFEETGAYATNNENLYAVKIQEEKLDFINGAPDYIAQNRLYGLYATKIANIDSPSSPFYTKNSISPDPLSILTYDGGPGSDLGVGKTNIKFADQRTVYIQQVNNPLNQNNVLTFTNQQIAEIPSDPNTSGESFLIGQSNSTSVVGDFRKSLRANTIQSSLGLSPASLNYATKNIESRVGLGTPGDVKSKNLLSYVEGAAANDNSIPLGAASPTSYDKVNIIPLYSTLNTDLNPNDIGNDLVKFRIGVINNNNPSKKTYIHFRAFLDQISDQYTSDWDPTQYIGRGEKFYTYKGFDRKVSLSWTVAAQSKAELIPMYRKLNYLASVCAPDYSGNGYMRGNIITLTIGGYFYEQPGLITGFSYEMNDDNATWEIGINDSPNGGSDPSVKELPHLIKVTGFNFIPIHTFVPRLQQNAYGNPESPYDSNTYGDEKYIALSAGTIDNYTRKAPDIEQLNPINLQPLPSNIPSPTLNI